MVEQEPFPSPFKCHAQQAHMLKESTKVTLCRSVSKDLTTELDWRSKDAAKREREMTECGYVGAAGTSRLATLVSLHCNRKSQSTDGEPWNQNAMVHLSDFICCILEVKT